MAGQLTDTRPPSTQALPAAPRPGAILAPLGALGTVVALVIGVVADPSALPFVAPPMVIGLVAAGLAWRFGTWAKVVAGLWGVAALVQLPMTPLLGGLTRPDSLFDFVPGWLFVLSAVTAIAGGVLAVVRRGHDTSAGERRWRAVVVAVLAVLLASSGIASTTSDSELTAAQREGAIEVVLVDSVFQPDDVALTTGDVTFAVRNDGRVLHNFTVTELGIDEDLSPGQEVLVSATIPDGATTFVFYCQPHSEVTDQGREGMVATARVS